MACEASQDAPDAYAMYDVREGKYLFMKGFGASAVTLDGSDKDDLINIHSTFGGKPAYKLRMPDQVTSFTHDDGRYYFITANEGGSRDGGDGLLGEFGEFDGEETRMGKVCVDGDLTCENDELGRVLTTGYQPSDYAINACGNNLCAATGLASGLDGEGAAAIPGVKGSGAFKCIYVDADYGGCGSVCNLHDDHYEWADPSGCGTYPPTIAHYVDSDADNAYYGAACTEKNCYTSGWRYAGWASKTGVQPSLAESPTSPNPLGYDAAVACQQLCDAEPDCAHFYMEFEMGKFECFLKGAFGDERCHEYSYKDDSYEYSGGVGGKPFVKEGFANWGGPRSSDCASPAPYSTVMTTPGVGPGSTGGAITIGGRSFTIYSWAPGETGLTEVFDSGDMMEQKQAVVAGKLCEGCKTGSTNVNGDKCDDVCPFNSDEAPPKFDDRSDAKGPEPECVTTGVTSDGRRLAFIGLERTGEVSRVPHACLEKLG